MGDWMIAPKTQACPFSAEIVAHRTKGTEVAIECHVGSQRAALGIARGWRSQVNGVRTFAVRFFEARGHTAFSGHPVCRIMSHTFTNFPLFDGHP